METAAAKAVTATHTDANAQLDGRQRMPEVHRRSALTAPEVDSQGGSTDCNDRNDQREGDDCSDYPVRGTNSGYCEVFEAFQVDDHRRLWEGQSPGKLDANSCR
jgi:hypothetical protein